MTKNDSNLKKLTAVLDRFFEIKEKGWDRGESLPEKLMEDNWFHQARCALADAKGEPRPMSADEKFEARKAARRGK